MGCNCGKGGGSTIAARSASRRSDARAASYTQDAPLLIGDAGGTLIRVRVMVPIEGLGLGRAAWVTGTGVQAHIDSGALVDITATAQRARLWRVGEFTYTTESEARRVAAATGQAAVEVA